MLSLNSGKAFVILSSFEIVLELRMSIRSFFIRINKSLGVKKTSVLNLVKRHMVSYV